MLIKIKKNGVLIFKKFRFRSVLGKLGIKKIKKKVIKPHHGGLFLWENFIIDLTELKK